MFEGQREAAIREHEAGLTLIRDTFRDVPTAIDIDPHYSDELWVKDSRFENISRPAVIISNEKSPLTEIGFENAVLKDVPVFALFRESGKKVSGKGAMYRVGEFQLWTHRARRGNDRRHRHALRRHAAERYARATAAGDPARCRPPKTG